jgi:pimeloyl-ACP methyl ester carboxylesterase
MARDLSRSKQRPPLLFIHGSGSGSWVWNRWMQEMAGMRWSCWAPDLRGHGASTAVDMRFVSMLDYLEDIKGVIRDHFPAPPVVIGWSMGGLLAAMTAAGQPVAACVMLAPSPPKAVLGEVDHGAVDSVPVLVTPAEYGIDAAHPEASPALHELTIGERRRVAELMRDDSGLARRERKRGIAVEASLGAPALVIAGEQDQAIPFASSESTAAYFGAELLRVPGSGHWGIVLGGGVPDLALRLDSWLRHRLDLG